MATRYQHLSPAFLADDVNRLDAVFGDLSHRSVTTPQAILLQCLYVLEREVASRTGVEPVSPP